MTETGAMTGGRAMTDVAVERASLSWPILGRSAERARIADLLGSESSSGAVLVGEAGVGKTRLAREALRDAERAATIWVVASESASTIPLGAFAPVLSPGDRGVGDLLDLLQAATVALSATAGGRPLVVGIDDAHHLDPVSAALVHQLAASGAAKVLATLRARARAPDAVVALWKDQLAERIEVQALTEAHCGEVVTAALGGPVEAGTLQLLWRVSTGNPLFLHELVLSGLETEALTSAGGLWRWRGQMGAGARLQEVLERRLERLDAASCDALEHLAFGEPLGIGQFEELVALEVVDSLERNSLLHVSRDRRRENVRLGHPLYAEVLRATVPPLRARAIQRRLADLIAASGARRREDALRVGTWRLAGGGATSADLLVAAAWQALSAFDFALAERLARAALDVEEGIRGYTVLAETLRAQARPAEAEAVLERLIEQTEDAPTRVDLAISRAAILFFGLGRVDDADTVLDDIDATGEACGRSVELTSQRAMFLLYRGQVTAAATAALAALDEPGLSDEEQVDLAMAAVPALALSGRTAESIELADRLVLVALQLPVVAGFKAGVLLAGRFLALALGGRLAEAEELAMATYRLAAQARSHDGKALFACAIGQVLGLQGRVRSAQEWLREGASLLREADRNGYLPWCLGELATMATLSADEESARAALDEADRAQMTGLHLFDVAIDLGRAWAAMAAGDATGAVSEATSSAVRAGERGQPVFEALSWHAACRFGCPEQHPVERLDELAGTVENDLVTALAAHARALVNGDAAALEAAATRFEEMGARLLAAEAAAAATSLHQHAGRTSAAAVAGAHARALLAECEEARPPTIAETAEPTPLTAREHEIALLAAGGLTSRAIADRLYLSVRTVDNHLQRAYEKLGVRGRGELAAVLGIATAPH
jgi:DNA-binding CsgD family transcriptional regulator